MKVIVQRVVSGSVIIDSENYSAEIKKGMVLLVGIKVTDTISDVNYAADKCCKLRIFDDSDGVMNLSIKDIGGEVLIISQFTLYGETSKGNRPSYIEAARPEQAIPLYESFINRIKDGIGSDKVKTGLFGTMMLVKINNDGPVTLIVDSERK